MSECLPYSNLRELFNDGGYFFQLTLGRKLLSRPHCHDFYEMICVLTGSCVHRVNDTEQVCTEGDAILLRPTDTHSFYGQSEATNIASVSILAEEAVPFLRAYGLADAPELDPAASMPPRAAIKMLERPEFRELCERIFSLTEREQTPLCRVLLGKFCAAMIQNGTQDKREIPPSFSAVLSEMDRLPCAAEGIGAFLRLSNFSHAQLCRLTRKYLNQTPGEYVNGIRMKYAWKLVAAGELDFETICETVGFASYSYFCRLFEKTYGSTPARVRRTRRQGGRTI